MSASVTIVRGNKCRFHCLIKDDAPSVVHDHGASVFCQLGHAHWGFGHVGVSKLMTMPCSDREGRALHQVGCFCLNFVMGESLDNHSIVQLLSVGAPDHTNFMRV